VFPSARNIPPGLAVALFREAVVSVRSVRRTAPQKEGVFVVTLPPSLADWKGRPRCGFGFWLVYIFSVWPPQGKSTKAITD